MKPVSRLIHSSVGQKLINLYLGGEPDPEWKPLFTFPWGEMALPGERGRSQAAKRETAEWLYYFDELRGDPE